jgi:glycerol 3-phosphatase-2
MRLPSILSRNVAATPLDGIDVVLSDLDGVVYQGANAIAQAVDALGQVSTSGLRVGYITNNASRTDEQVAEHLSSFGLSVSAADVVTSPQAAVRILAGLVPAGSLILVVGGDGLVDELQKGGFPITRTAADGPAAVIQGFAPDVGWKQLAEASFALKHDIPWVATNTDWTIPVAGGIAPGNGTLVSAVHTAVGKLPVVAGKPEVAIFEEAERRFGAAKPLFIGDRLDTDILGATRAGMPVVHVMTGIDRAKQLLAAKENERPQFILQDLRGLFLPYPVTVMSHENSRATVGKASVRLVGNDIQIVKRGDSELDLLRAACAMIWNSGRAIYGLNVPTELYE